MTAAFNGTTPNLGDILLESYRLTRPVLFAKMMIERGAGPGDEHSVEYFYELGCSVAALMAWAEGGIDDCQDPNLSAKVWEYYKDHAFTHGGIDKLWPDIREQAMTDLGKFVASVFQTGTETPG